MDKDKLKKILMVIFTVLFLLLFIFIGVGSCGGIKYLLDNHLESDPVTVHADGLNYETGYNNSVIVSLSDYKFIDVYGSEFYFLTPLIIEFDPTGKFNFSVFYFTSEVIGTGNPTLTLESYEFLEHVTGHRIDFSAVEIYRPTEDVEVVRRMPLFLTLSRLDSGSFADKGRFVAVQTYLSGGRIYIQLIFESTYIAEFRLEYYLGTSEQYSFYATNGNGEQFYNLLYIDESEFESTVDYYMDNLGGNQLVEDNLNVIYNEGVDDAVRAFNRNYNTNFTFASFLSAIFDTNVDFFSSLITFNFLGYDFSNFYKFLIGLSLIIVTLRFIT